MLDPSEVLEYHAFVAHNREVFLLNHGEEIACWEHIADVFSGLRQSLRKGRAANGKTHVSLLPFVLLAQRQTMIGLDCLATAQSHAAWPLLRPLLEAALVMGKWMDDPRNASIWQKQQVDRKAYMATYTGKGLQSASLPGSDAIQQALRRVNDDCEHMNERFYHAHTQATPLRGGCLVEVPMFDADPPSQEANLYAATHLVLVVLSSVERMLAGRLQPAVSGTVPLTQYQALRLARVVELAGSHPELHSLLVGLGLWPL
jgi:hypothetical protein